ncbi:hypothetical protein ASZ90_014907 [hydrocarbon metagenome]|uniref:Lipoprotein n=1 Tax=hydrocarbon metagenome TaxID=938273 RepID=A0A0W8F3G4_9ZZZZ
MVGREKIVLAIIPASLLAIVVLSGCISTLPGEDNAPALVSLGESREIAREYVRAMPEYRDYRGRNLTLIEETPFDCTSCYEFAYTFDMQSMKDPLVVDRGTVWVSVREGRVIGVVASYGKNE